MMNEENENLKEEISQLKSAVATLELANDNLTIDLDMIIQRVIAEFITDNLSIMVEADHYQSDGSIGMKVKLMLGGMKISSDSFSTT